MPERYRGAAESLRRGKGALSRRQDLARLVAQRATSWVEGGAPSSEFQSYLEQLAQEVRSGTKTSAEARKVYEEAARRVSPGGKANEKWIKSLFTKGPEGLKRANQRVLSSLKSAGINVGQKGKTTGRGVAVGATSLAKWFMGRSWYGKAALIVGAFIVGRVGVGQLSGKTGGLNDAYGFFRYLGSGIGSLAWSGEWDPLPYRGEEKKEEPGRPATLEENMTRAMQRMEETDPAGYMQTLMGMKELSRQRAYEEGEAQGQAGAERAMSDLQFARGFSETEIPIGAIALEEAQRVMAGMPPSGALSPLAGFGAGGAGPPSEEVPPEMYQQALGGGTLPPSMGG